MEEDLKKNKNEDDLKKMKKMKTTSKKNEDDLKKNLFLIPLKFSGKPFLGLAQLSKILFNCKIDKIHKYYHNELIKKSVMIRSPIFD